MPKVPTDIRSLARAYTEANIATLGGIATGDGVEMEHKLRAIGMLLDRGWGKPNQETQVTGSLEVILRDIMAEKQKQQT